MLDYKISIIVPAYNVEKYITKCVMSLLEQTYKNLEIIIVNDGSVDSTGEIVDAFVEKDKRIYAIHQKNGGLPNARNTGLRCATGQYVMFLDSDDWLEPNCCENIIQEIEKENADLLFFEYYKEFKDKTVTVQTYKNKKLIYNSKGIKEFPIYDMRTITAWGKIYSKKLIGNNLFDEKMKTAEDVGFNYHIYDKVNVAVYINVPLLHYRILEHSAIHGFDSRIIEKLEYPLDVLYSWSLKDEIHKKAYYSFLAIAYLLICQNGICQNNHMSFRQKVIAIKKIKSYKRYQTLFQNTEYIKIPNSRKMIIWFGKVNLNLMIIMIVMLKQMKEKRT